MLQGSLQGLTRKYECVARGQPHPFLPRSGAIAGGVLAGLVAVAIVIIVVILGAWIYRRSLYERSKITDSVRLCDNISVCIMMRDVCVSLIVGGKPVHQPHLWSYRRYVEV